MSHRGGNDAATVSSDAQTLTETDVALSTSGTLTSSDPDNPDADVITDFTVGLGGDVLNLADLLQGEQSNPTTDYLSIEFGDFDGDLDSESRITIDADGGGFFQPTGSITLETIDLTQGGSLTDQEILNNLITNGILDIDT